MCDLAMCELVSSLIGLGQLYSPNPCSPKGETK